MRKIKMLNRVSIDGYFASSNEANFGMDWFIHDPEVDKAAHEIGGRMDTLLLGGTTYRGFERSWVPVLNDPRAPEQLKQIAEELTEMSKVVFSNTIQSSDWSNTQIYNGDLIQVVSQLKRESSTDILVLGSGSIVQQLANEGLIDEYMFIVTPVVAGEGKRMFPDVMPFHLGLAEARTFESGNVLLHYVLKK
ncbi:dihydrofolate reductase family protein [Paenibacillus sp. J5C_2022]|uniref:dihydrofolate reductase family protein n=1 Tax=Paenibacillus sp. J5C2022 TaxID=2977129 RepID=UPI0021CFA9DA|nr:dihydrofolate reductase family protein [Paenibacillus sp. J5C2022]MCU6709949.1 dihydrofolate reductase family protein [Paenibacillus sp. J5C2022]